MKCRRSVRSRLGSSAPTGLPSYANIPGDGLFSEGVYLGKQYNPLATGNPNDSNFEVQNLALQNNLTLSRLGDRRALLNALDDQRRLADTRGVAGAYNEFAEEAFQMVTSKAAQQAFAIEEEPEAVREL